MAKSTNITKTFVQGRMNKVIDERLLPEGEYIDAHNIRLGSTEQSEIGSVENAKGNDQLTTLTYIDVANTPLTASTRCIGAYEDSATNTLYWFVHDPAFQVGGAGPIYKLDMIVSYNTILGTLTYHVVSIGTTSTLNFNPTYLITGVNLVDNMLFWTDDYNPPRKINILKSYPYPVAAVDQITAEELLVIKKPPQESPVVTTSSTAGQENFMEGRFICFAYRYKYEDGEYSATSQFSAPAFVPDNFQFSPDSFLNIGMLNINNAATIEFDSGNELVKEIDLLFKEADSSIIKKIEGLNKVEVGYLDNTTYTYFFDNSKIYTVLPESEILRLYDNVPKLAKAQTLMGNRLVYGNYTEGYDLLDHDGQKVDLSYVTSLVSTPIEETELSFSLANYTYTVDAANTVNDAEITISTAGIDLVASSVLVVGVKLIHDSFTFTAPVTAATAPVEDVYVTLVFTLPQDYTNGFDMASSVPFGVAVGSTTFINPLEITCTSTPTLSDRFNCLVAVSVAATQVAPGVPLNPTMYRYQSGVTFLNQGVQISAVATAPDEFKLIFPAIRYIDDGTTPRPAIPYLNTATMGDVYSYYKPSQIEASFRSLNIPRSLHSNRGYELGIVYMDEFNRSTQSLVSESNTVHVPCSSSPDQNQIKVTIPTTQVAPEWAYRYKFVIKPDMLGFNTVFSNIVYTSLATNYSYVLLEGENSAKVTEGDELILKSDIDGPIESCLTITVLEKTSEERDFLTVDDGATAGTVSGLVPMAGTYMKINNNGFNAVMPEDSFILPGQVSETEKDGGECTEIAYSFSGPATTPPSNTDYDIPAGSRIRVKITWKRKGPGDGNNACERRIGKIDRWFSASQDYNNAKDWWDDDNVADSICNSDPNVAFDYWEVGGGDCDMANSYNPILLTLPSLGAALDALGCDVCTNYFQWFREGGVTTNPLYLLISGTQACASAQWSKRRHSTLKVTFEIYQAENVMVFETKPGDALPDLWYEGEASYPIDRVNGNHLGNITRYIDNTDQNIAGGTAGIIYSQFFNCYSFGNGVESYKIKDSMVGKSFTLGNRAYATAGQDKGEADRFADLTYSGVINDESNVNKLNEFNLGLLNFKPLEDSYGEVMKLDGRRSDILVLQEHKISYVLAGKDILTDAGGGGALTATPLVLGQQIARVEEFGISKNPESYAQYGPDKFFTDEKRGALIQLRGSAMQNEQLSVISELGMRSWFRDQFVDPTYVGAQKLGGFDPYMNEYVLSINDIDLPFVAPCIGCGLQFSVDMAITPTWSFCIDVGETVGDVVVNWQIVNAGEWSGGVTYATVTTAIPATTVSGSVTITKASPFPTTLTIEGLATPGTTPSIDLTIDCPVTTPLTLVLVCLTDDVDAAKTIHNQTNWSLGSYVSNLVPTDSSAPVTFASGTDYPLVSQYQVFTGPQGSGGIPLDGANVQMYTRKLGADDFVFDDTAGKDEYYFLRTNTNYPNTPTGMTNLMAAITAAGAGAGPLAIDSTLAPNQYSLNTPIALVGPLGATGDYLYLVYDYRESVSAYLCYTASTASPAADKEEACCDCTDCGAQCTQYAINWVSGPAAKITYNNCVGTPSTANLNPGTGVSICCFPGTAYTVVSTGTTIVNDTVTLCGCV